MRHSSPSWRLARLQAAAFGVCLALALAPLTARAAQNTAPDESPGDMAREGLEQMMRALRLLVESIPQYELPEVLENGDIIIRRKHGDKRPTDEPEIDETAT
jgi:hypothetical protein